jgi:hypothetical protein
MPSSPSVGLVRGLVFKVLLAVMALCCFVIALPQIWARVQLTRNGIPATIRSASASATAPTDWSDYEGAPRALFPVRIATDEGASLAMNLFLPETAVRQLLDGDSVRITMVRNNPRMFRLAGAPLPPLGGGWILLGLLLGATFLFSLRLR